MLSVMRVPALVAVVALLCLVSEANTGRTVVASHSGSASAISVDMDPAGNTATALGGRQACASIIRNGAQDADEDVVDGVTADVTITSLPASDPAIGYAYGLLYDETNLSVVAYEGDLFLASLPGSQIFHASDDVPDADGANTWLAVEIDVGPNPDTSESGSGALQHVTIGADSAAASGVYDIILDPENSGSINPENHGRAPDTLENARLAVNIACPPTDTDGDKVYDIDEAQCGGDPYSAASRPERIDGVYANVSDDGDSQIDEALPANIPMADCDGDGFTGTAEDFVYSPSTQGDQDPCGAAPAAAPFNAPIGWPADLKTGGIPDSTNKINVGDIVTFLAPVRRLDTSPGDPGYDVRWDVVPGNSGQAKEINSVDYYYVANFAPAMLGSVRAFNGPPCPW